METDTAKQTGGVIRSRRKALKMTLGQLSEAADIDVSQLSKLERGVCGASVATINRIAAALAWSPAEFWRHASKVPGRAA